MKTIVIGLGNPILGDDGVGWKVAAEVKKRLPRNTPIDLEFLSLGGISLMEHLIGYERAILVDAVKSDQETGSIIVSKLSEMPDYSAFHVASAHDTSLQNALKLGKGLGAKLPDDVIVVGIATNRIYDFSENLSPPVERAVSQA
ncbi:MAG TPA: hydrogenase maturation protease, partial [Anaerolineales bacterium]